ncbi:MAG: chemotaxis-specific protein-glutamate methyltransferase CheB [Alphaproteobacteria bacterium]|uniref:chemotaxis-specific protein-glutamate methyltransferase CheB n=1 Tax=Nisaea sp. TaxID=2024842 RepID=UPI003265C62F
MSSKRPIRVMIVEDERVVRLLLEHIIGDDPRLEVVASVGSGEEALETLPKVKPDVISLDIRLPGINGFEVTRRVMSEHPTPIVVVSASVQAEDLRISMNALRAGALSVVEKPVGVTSSAYSEMADRLCRNLMLMSDVRIVRQRNQSPQARKPVAVRPPPSSCSSNERDYRLLGLVASTGGPNALVEVLKCLGPEYPLPIALVQHITASFLEGFAAWLSEVSRFKVEIVSSPADMVPGCIYLAPADRHLEVIGHRAIAVDAPKVSSQRPSGTVLFRSMARTVARRGIGVLLTGMGDDGAEGLLALREAGGHTIAENEATAVVYGMPKAAFNLGAVEEQLPLHKIGPRLKNLTDSVRVLS